MVEGDSEVLNRLRYYLSLNSLPPPLYETRHFSPMVPGYRFDIEIRALFQTWE